MLCSFLIFSAHAETITFEKGEFSASYKLGNIGLIHNEAGYHVTKEDKVIDIQPAFIEKQFRNMSTGQLEKFLGRNIKIVTPEEFEVLSEDIDMVELSEEEYEPLLSKGYLIVGQNSEGEYTLKSNMRLLGGGCFGAWAACWFGKIAAVGASQLLIFCVSAPCVFIGGPAMVGIVHKTLTIATAPAVVATSTDIDLAADIAGAILTGPV